LANFAGKVLRACSATLTLKFDQAVMDTLAPLNYGPAQFANRYDEQGLAPSSTLLNQCCIYTGAACVAAALVVGGLLSFGVVPAVAITGLALSASGVGVTGLMLIVGGRSFEAKEKLARLEDEARDCLKDFYQNPTLQRLYAMSSQTPEFSGKNGLLRHHFAVVKNFNNFMQADFREKTGCDREFMFTVLALHDIGKGQGQKDEQHAYTKDVIKEYAKETRRINENLARTVCVWISENLTKIICELITQDPIGHVLKLKGNSAAMRSALAELDNGFLKIQKYWPEMTRDQYFEVISVFYRCDAGAYPSLKARLLTDRLEYQLGFVSNTVSSLRSAFCAMRPLPTVTTVKRTFRRYGDKAMFRHDVEKWLKKISDNDKLGVTPSILDRAGKRQYAEDLFGKYNISITTEVRGNVIGIISDEPCTDEGVLPQHRDIKQRNWLLYF
jgi:hypothetical protein